MTPYDACLDVCLLPACWARDVSNPLTPPGLVQVIAYLETGTGKTLIAVLLISYYIESVPRPMAANVQPPDAEMLKRMVICLVPTVILVAQQAGVFRRYSKHSVREYLGAKGIDEWDRERWNKERRCAPFRALCVSRMDCTTREYSLRAGCQPMGFSLSVSSISIHATRQHACS